MTLRFVLAAAALVCSACATTYEPNLIIFHHVDDIRGERVTGARVRACHGQPTIHPQPSQVIAQTLSAWNGEFLIETDPARTDFLVIDHAGLYANIQRPWSHMPHIILRHPSVMPR